MRSRPDMLDENSPAGATVIQITGRDTPSCHIYMEAQIFTPDSRRFVLRSGPSATPHGDTCSREPDHCFLLCDIEDNCALSPLTDELGATGPSISPDGKYLYYLVDKTILGGSGAVFLKRVKLDGTDRETLMAIDNCIPGTDYRPSKFYVLSTISSDGRRFAASCFLGDGRTVGAPFGLVVFDLEAATAELILEGQAFCNMHPQYSRSLDPAACRDLLIQENHGMVVNAMCTARADVSRTDEAGADIHVIRDDGSDLRDMPWGRDGNERVQGHQCWMGRSTTAITSTSTLSPRECQLIAGQAVPHAGHVGLKSPGAEEARNDLSRDFPNPRFFHFATDIAGRRLISDFHDPAERPLEDRRLLIYVADLPQHGGGPLANTAYILTAACRGADNHAHPFFSPDGTKGFFNSNESGILQAYMITGI